MRVRRNLILGFVLTLYAALHAFAQQQPAGALGGQVRDELGGLVANANVNAAARRPRPDGIWCRGRPDGLRKRGRCARAG